MDWPLFVFLSFCLLVLIQLFFHAGLLSKRRIANTPTDKLPPVSILICARNEAINLQRNLPFYLKQRYPEFELIVVNDRSTDHSDEILSQFAEQNDNVRIINNDLKVEKLPGKRHALHLGINAARHSKLLLSDADCYPASKYWIRRMVEYSGAKNICLGYGDYKRKAGILNAVIRYETFHNALLYYSLTSAGMPYMGVGRNMLIKKNLLDKYLVNSVIPGLESGDDDLLINSLPQGLDIALASSFNSRTISYPGESWRSYIRQKSRHLGTSTYYRPHIKMLLGIIYGSSLLFWILFVILLFTGYWDLSLIIFILRYLMVYWIAGRSMSSFIKGLKLFLFPFYEFIIFAVHCLAWASRVLNLRNDWK